MTMKVLFGKKLGMTQLFDSNGLAKGVTAIEVWPGDVLRLKSEEKDGYTAAVVGAGKLKKTPKSAGKAGYRVVRELPAGALKVGDTLGIEQIAAGEVVAATATSKGKGFQGTVKRHNFSRGPKTHGSRNYRAPGSIGGTGAARVFAGQKMPGRMGAATVTTKNLTVVGVHADDNVVLIRGSVPGPTGALVKLVSLAAVKDAEENAPTSPPQDVNSRDRRPSDEDAGAEEKSKDEKVEEKK